MKPGSLVPGRIGEEHYELIPGAPVVGGVKVFAGSGFNPDNPQHFQGSDAVRWAIALQQLRDAGNFDELDAAREVVAKSYFVMQERDGTRLFPLPRGYACASKKAKAEMRLVARAVIVDGKIFDEISS